MGIDGITNVVAHSFSVITSCSCTNGPFLLWAKDPVNQPTITTKPNNAHSSHARVSIFYYWFRNTWVTWTPATSPGSYITLIISIAIDTDQIT